MSDTQTHTTDAEDLAHYKTALRELIDMGMDVACRLKHQATESEFPDTTIACAKAYDSMARTVRRTILLATKLAKPPRAPRDTVQARTDARKQLIRGVEDAIGNNRSNREELQAEFLDRLDSPETEDDLESRPVQDIVADLGLYPGSPTMPKRRRTPADLQILAFRAATIPAGTAPTPSPSGRGSGRS